MPARPAIAALNPLRLRLPIPARVDARQRVPGAAEIRDWLDTLPRHKPAEALIQVAALVVRLNHVPLGTSQRLDALEVIQPWAMALLPRLQKKYHDQSLPLSPKLQSLADGIHEFLDELAQGYKQIINDALTDAENDDLSTGRFQLALRQTIEQTGLLLLECYAQYRSEPLGLWGELHRLYELAERNGLHNMPVEATDAEGQPLTTIQYTYLRIALLGLAQPYRLLAGQATVLYRQLAKWTLGCQLVERRDTLVEAGDCVVDLAGDRAPQMATEQTRFRPVDGRFLDIEALHRHLETLDGDEPDPDRLSLPERLRHDLLRQLREVWRGRGERQAARQADGVREVRLCVGLGAAHHQISGEVEFNPERTEHEIHRPSRKGSLSLLSREEEALLQSDFGVRTAEGLEATRVSRFEVETDVWDAVNDTSLHARMLRESAMAGYALEPWQRINFSTGGVALRRHRDNRSQVRVGALVAWHPEDDLNRWRVGSVRWMQRNRQGQLEIGVRTLGRHMAPVAVRAIGGAGSGGEYFRSLLIDFEPPAGEAVKGVLVPVGIYDAKTQLVLNLGSELKYVSLTRLLETTSSYSLFAYRFIDVPPQEKARIQALPHDDED